MNVIHSEAAKGVGVLPDDLGRLGYPGRQISYRTLDLASLTYRNHNILSPPGYKNNSLGDILWSKGVDTARNNKPRGMRL